MAKGRASGGGGGKVFLGFLLGLAVVAGGAAARAGNATVTANKHTLAMQTRHRTIVFIVEIPKLPYLPRLAK